MDFAPFFTRLPDIAQKETTVLIIASSKNGPSRGEYVMIESYCTDKTCNCAKVMLNIFPKEKNTILATVGYGWEDLAFYIKWAYGMESLAKDITGTYLEPGGYQSQYAHFFLDK